ncbi:MAG: FAD-dependent oxidoreductase, partial [Myxococcales bacterium]|nr:FAD-dependent oxidoreductase [Myxococcales bacterium]
VAVAAARVVARLADEARAVGVEFRLGEPVRELAMAGDRVIGVLTGAGALLEADSVVVAAGAWTPNLLPWLRGYLWTTSHPVLHFRPRAEVAERLAGLPTWSLEVAETGFYGFPLLPDGILKVARHAEGIAGLGPSVRAPGVAVERAFRTFLDRHLPPVVQGPRVGGRWCRYCDTLDGDFWIGRDPERPGLTVAAGGAGHGFKFAPLLGALIADAVEGARHPRFGWRLDGAVGMEAARAPVPS